VATGGATYLSKVHYALATGAATYLSKVHCAVATGRLITSAKFAMQWPWVG